MGPRGPVRLFGKARSQGDPGEWLWGRGRRPSLDSVCGRVFDLAGIKLKLGQRGEKAGSRRVGWRFLALGQLDTEPAHSQRSRGDLLGYTEVFTGVVTGLPEVSTC